MKLVKIKAYKFKELSEKAQHVVSCNLDNFPFDYEVETSDGEYITKYEYFSDWSKDDQIEFCNLNEYLFNKNGEMIHHLIEG